MFKKIRIPPIFVIAGFTTTILFSVIWVVASIINGDWLFGLNMVSDLGVSPQPSAQILFNYGCVLTAVAGGAFGVGVAMNERGAMFAAGIFTVVGVFFLMGVGAIPESLGTAHSVCAFSFAGFCILAIICSIVGDLRAKRNIYVIASVILIIVTVVCTFFDHRALLEAVAIICILAWVAIQAYKYYTIFGFVEYENLVSVMLEKK